MARAPDRGVVVRAALAEIVRASGTRARSLGRLPLGPRTPDRLLFAPQDLRGADPAIAAAIVDGHYVLGGRGATIRAASPFDIDPPTAAWAEELRGFTWLRHLRAADTPDAREAARRLLARAVERRRGAPFGSGDPPSLVARRVISLLAHSPSLLAGAPPSLYPALLGQIGRDAEALRRATRDDPRPGERLAAAIGLSFAALATGGLERRLKRATDVLAVELPRTVGPDGAPGSRDPAALVALLLDLLPLRLLYGSRGVPTPPAVDRAIDRAVPMLRALRHGSGEIALFNGAGETAIGELMTVLSFDRTGGALPDPGPRAGYARLEADRTLLFVDIGRPPELASAATACAGPLSFELSSGTERIVVNRGLPESGGRARQLARLTSAHSTLTIDGASAGRPLGLLPDGWAVRHLAHRYGDALIGGARSVTSERGTGPDGDLLLSAEHDGFRAFGIRHARKLRVAADGSEVEGEDRAILADGAGKPGRTLRLRFHLHPAVVAGPGDGGSGLLLALPSGERWRFGVDGPPPRLERDVYHAASGGRRATSQIVVDVPPFGSDEREVSLRWLFLRA